MLEKFDVMWRKANALVYTWTMCEHMYEKKKLEKKCQEKRKAKEKKLNFVYNLYILKLLYLFAYIYVLYKHSL